MPDSPITTECEALRQEVELLAAENRRLLNQLNSKPAYPEAAVRAVWEHGARYGWDVCNRCDFVTDVDYILHAEEIGRVFVEALRDA